jgi:hypothetical protein
VVGVVAAASCVFAAVASSASELTPAQYKARVNKACATFNAHIRSQRQPGTSQAAAARWLVAWLRYGRVEIGEIEALAPPVRYRAFQKELLTVQRAEVARVEVLLPRVRTGALTFEKLAQDKPSNVLDSREQALFKKFGAPACLA